MVEVSTSYKPLWLQLTFTDKKIKETNGFCGNDTNLSETVLLTLKIVLCNKTEMSTLSPSLSFHIQTRYIPE